MSEQHEITLRLTREQANDYGIAMLHAGRLAAMAGDVPLLAKIDALRNLLHEALYPEEESDVSH
ncbi:MAG: hypothetical protein ABI324_19690 [Ktedonobacteraceae bacterium]